MRFAPAHRLLALAAVASLSVALASAPATALAATSRSADEILEVNVRPASCATNATTLAARIDVNEYALTGEVGSRGWVDSTLPRLTDPVSPDMVTIFFIHGNKVDPCMARDRGLRVYRSLMRCSCDDRPVRFVIFSWPATEVNGFLHDFRVKAARTRPVGWQLAWVLNQMPPDAKISLLGYSYGARIAGGALHLLRGGQLNGLTLSDPPAQPHVPMRVAFLAAATHAHWYGPNCYHGMAMEEIEHLILLNNEIDPAMRLYKWVEKNSSPQAMGLCGPARLSSDARRRVECYDCSDCVGRSHDLFKYLGTGRTMNRVWQNLTYAD